VGIGSVIHLGGSLQKEKLLLVRSWCHVASKPHDLSEFVQREFTEDGT